MIKSKLLKMGNITQKCAGILKPFSRNYSAKFTASDDNKINRIRNRLRGGRIENLINSVVTIK